MPAEQHAPESSGQITMSRRTALTLMGSTAVAAWATTRGLPSAHADPAPGTHVGVLVNGAPAGVGTYRFPDEVDSLVLDNGLIRFTFGRDDAAGGIVTGWGDVSITAQSVMVNGVELAHNLNGVEPRDPDRQHSFYIDASGGRTRLVCTEVRVIRATPELAEVAFVDTTGTPLQHEHHLIMRAGVRGLYGYNILTAVAATSINEVRMNTRWDRSIFDHAYNWERGGGQQPTYAYLATQTRIQDETWQIDGVNNPNLPSPDSNCGNLPPGSIYTKYDWSLYHHQNPMFGHYGNGFGVWCTPLGGVTEDTLCAYYGVGPQHQDLAIHQDALILNYFGANHYGLPAYALFAGYRRLYGPWLTYVTVGDPSDPDTMIAEAADIARAQIAENRNGATWIVDDLYPEREARSTVIGRLSLTDGRPAANFWVVLSTQAVADVYTIHEPTYFVKTDVHGNFRLPGIPSAWQPGTTNPGTYTLYAFAADGSVTGQYVQSGVTVVPGSDTDLGDITWDPGNHGTFLWQIGRADRTAGEYALATLSPALPMPRGYVKPSQIPGTLTFTIGADWEPEGWYYAQTNPGVWTVSFTLDRAYAGTAYLTVSTAMQSGGRPSVAVNGNTSAISGTLPPNNDSTIGRQADRSGFPRLATLSFPASLLTTGVNSLTFTHGAASAAGSGPGWDTLVLEVDEGSSPAAAVLSGQAELLAGAGNRRTWRLTIANTGEGAANDLRLTGVGRPGAGSGLTVSGRDPNKFPVPLVGSLAPGQAVTYDVDVLFAPGEAPRALPIQFSANGGRARGTAIATP